MIRGFELFREHFSEFSDHFILIGGTACELTFMDSGGFRVTKDIDIPKTYQTLIPLIDGVRQILAADTNEQAED